MKIEEGRPFKVLEEMIGEPYDERRDKAERWLMENAYGPSLVKRIKIPDTFESER